MSKTSKVAPATARKPWVRPVVEKIAAGQAEVGNRSTGDGNFGFS